ncbi:MAG: hypothetical protein AAB446_00885 [Patescibacteria group bacterium]
MQSKRYKKSSSIIAKRNKVRRVFTLSLKIGLPVIFLVGFVFVLRADFLQVKNFKVVGEVGVSVKDVQKSASDFISGNKLFVIPKSNIFLLNKGKMAAALIANFSRVEEVFINKQFLSSSIDIKIKERQADYLWCSLNECFFMTKDGLVFEKAGFTKSDFLTSSVSWAEPLNKLIFEGKLEGEPIMKSFATSERMQNYLRMVKTFKDAGFEIISINIESTGKATAKSNLGDIIFNPEEIDLSLIAQNAILLINDAKTKNPSTKFNYIDTRFGNKIFYKLVQ